MKGKIYSIYFLIAALLLAVNTTLIAADSKSEKSTTASAKEKININTASSASLQTLPGVGPSVADAIIAARPFKNVAALKDVRGIGETRYAEIRPLVTVGRTGSANAGAAASSTRGADKASQRPQKEIDQEAPPSASVPPAENRSTRGADKASQRPQGSVNQEAPPSSSTPPLTPSTTRGADKASQRPQGQVDREPSTTSRPAGKVNVNTASQAQLESLLGIGPVKAQAIIDNRPYKTKEDVMKVPGIKEGTYAEIEDHITVR